MSRAQIIDWDPARVPLFIEILGMWAASLKILFIYLRERDSQQEREHKQVSGRGRSRLPEVPDEGLLSGVLGSHHEPKTGA